MLAYVSPKRFKAINPQDNAKDWLVCCKRGAVYDLTLDTTRPATLDEVGMYAKGEIPNVSKFPEFNRQPHAGPMYKIGYRWGKWEIIGIETGRKRRGAKYICQCECGEVRRMEVGGIGQREYCSECYKKRRRDGNGS